MISRPLDPVQLPVSKGLVHRRLTSTYARPSLYEATLSSETYPSRVIDPAGAGAMGFPRSRTSSTFSPETKAKDPRTPRSRIQGTATVPRDAGASGSPTSTVVIRNLLDPSGLVGHHDAATRSQELAARGGEVGHARCVDIHEGYVEPPRDKDGRLALAGARSPLGAIGDRLVRRPGQAFGLETVDELLQGPILSDYVAGIEQLDDVFDKQIHGRVDGQGVDSQRLNRRQNAGEVLVLRLETSPVHRRGDPLLQGPGRRVERLDLIKKGRLPAGRERHSPHRDAESQRTHPVGQRLGREHPGPFDKDGKMTHQKTQMDRNGLRGVDQIDLNLYGPLCRQPPRGRADALGLLARCLAGLEGGPVRGAPPFHVGGLFENSGHLSECRLGTAPSPFPSDVTCETACFHSHPPGFTLLRNGRNGEDRIHGLSVPCGHTEYDVISKAPSRRLTGGYGVLGQ